MSHGPGGSGDGVFGKRVKHNSSSTLWELIIIIIIFYRSPIVIESTGVKVVRR
jgi:hypothetical protein